MDVWGWFEHVIIMVIEPISKFSNKTIMGVSWWRIRSRSWIIMLSFGVFHSFALKKGHWPNSSSQQKSTHHSSLQKGTEPPRACKCFHVCDPLTSSAPNQYDKNIFPAFVAEACLPVQNVMTWHQHGLSCGWKRSLETPVLQQETLHLIALREDPDLQSQLEVRLPKYPIVLKCTSRTQCTQSL